MHCLLFETAGIYLQCAISEACAVGVGRVLMVVQVARHDAVLQGQAHLDDTCMPYHAQMTASQQDMAI